MAPIASGRAVARRTIEAMRTFQPDVLHLHEPLSPGPNHAALVGTTLPAVGTFHSARAGRNGWYETFRPGLKPMMRRLAVSHRGVRGGQAPGHPDLRRRVRDRAERGRRRPASPTGPVTPSVGAGDPLRRPARAPEGPGGAARRVRRPRPRRRPVGRRRRPQTTTRCAGGGCRGSSGSGGCRDDEKQARLRGATIACFPALDGESFGVVLLEAMAAGTRSSRPTSTATARVPRRPGGDAGPAGRRRRAPHRVCGCCSTIPARRAALVAAGRRRADEFSMAHVAERFLPCTSGRWRRPVRPSAETKRSRARSGTAQRSRPSVRTRSESHGQSS